MLSNNIITIFCEKLRSKFGAVLIALILLQRPKIVVGDCGVKKYLIGEYPNPQEPAVLA
jgi:hypothetical protein